MTTTDSVQFKKTALEVKQYLMGFFKNPILSIRNVPDWSWQTVIILDVSMATLSAFLHGVVQLKVTAAVLGVVIAPIFSLLALFVFSGFFYYTFLFFFQRTIELRGIAIVVTLALIPQYILNTLTGLLSVFELVGTGLAGLLLMVGLVENFKLPRKSIIKLITGLYIIFAGFWVYSTLAKQRGTISVKEAVSPQSLDILKKEFEAIETIESGK